MNVIAKYKKALEMLDIKFHVDVIEIDMESEYADMGRMFAFTTRYRDDDNSDWAMEGELYFNSHYETEWNTPRALHRYKPFFEGYGFDYTPENVDTFVVLHEIGHLVLNELLMKNELYDKSYALNTHMINSLEDTHFDETKDGPFMPLVMSAMEQWCDNFAMVNFRRLYIALGEECVI